MVKKEIKNQRGYALIVTLFAIFLVMIFLIIPQYVESIKRVQDIDFATAFDYAQSQAKSTASPIRRDLDTKIYNLIDTALAKHLTDDKRARSRAGTPQGVYQCQGTIDTAATNLSETWSLCDPVNIFSTPNPFLQKSNQSIPDLQVVLPKTQPVNPDIYYQSIIKELKRDTENSFDYSLEITFVAERVLQDAVRRQLRIPPRPRIEQYRWTAKADIMSRSYNNIHMAYRVYYDIVTTVNIYDEDVDCGKPPPGSHPLGFATIISRSILKCQDPSKSPYDGDCPKVIVATNTLDPNSDYAKTCYDPSYNDTCAQKAKLDCPDETIEAGLCPVAPGVVFKANTSNKGTFVSTGCKTSNGAARSTGGYTYETAIKIVGIGSNHN